jgi:hypothetical protein
MFSLAMSFISYKLEKWISTAIKEQIRKNNVLSASRIVKKTTKKA